MTKKVKIEKLEMGQSAYSTVAPDYLKEMFNDVKYSWDSGLMKDIERGEFYEVCTCLSKNKYETDHHTTISKNGQCILCDHYTFQYELKGNRKIKQYTEKQILKIQEDKKKLCPKKVMKLMNKHRLNVGKVAEKLGVCEIELDKEILKFGKKPCGIHNGINVKIYFGNIIKAEEVMRLKKKHKLKKDQADEIGMKRRSYNEMIVRLKRYFPFLEKK